ncbi:hypothetical protein ACIQF6_21655 [Kitasatospora sp. NPDC092948]|uniref:restriction system modified-DNA reader domain-containing protein n=1 Tax=Kitasatospora sp. NPDC092948 TaxID=3364088 RepID=UPI0038064854
MTATTRTITVDDEVFAFLQAHSEPLVDTPNDVLRRLLLDTTTPAEPSTESTPGALLPFIERGWLEPGDELRHTKKRTGTTFVAHVTPEGCIRIEDGRVFALPSPALKAQVGTEINGWGQYRISRTGDWLQSLRTRLQNEQNS